MPLYDVELRVTLRLEADYSHAAIANALRVLRDQFAAAGVPFLHEPEEARCRCMTSS